MRTRFVVAALLFAAYPAAAADLRPPEGLPRYDLAINLDVAGHRASVVQNVLWTNKSGKPVEQLVFNVHSHFTPPQTREDVLKFARLLELFRMPFREAIYYATAFNLQKVEKLRKVGDRWERDELKSQWNKDLTTALIVPLPEPVPAGGSVAVALTYTIELPQKQGRWGQWKGVTFMTNWHPVLAFHSPDKGWMPTPFIPWHQPWFNEAGVFSAVVRLPRNEHVACTGSITKVVEDGETKDVHIGPVTGRDFALLTSSRYQEFSSEADNAGQKVKVKCLAFPEHEHYARSLIYHAGRAIENYSKWFGPYPYPEFTIAESYFGWNGNELSGLVMIDERVFGMPHLADGYLQYLISHETCHQWFYNVVGTDGYRETFMDEAIVTHLSHRLLDELAGKNNELFNFPPLLGWLPNIKRENYRFSQLYFTMKNGDLKPAVQELQKYEQVINLFAAVYDRGSKIVGMIQDRLGPVAFLEFMRRIYTKYYFRIITVADFQRELEEYTGRKWDEFFKEWLTTAGMSDWAVENVTVNGAAACPPAGAAPSTGYTATVILTQRAEINEETTLGFSFDGGTSYAIRVPIKVPRKEPKKKEPDKNGEKVGARGRASVVTPVDAKEPGGSNPGNEGEAGVPIRCERLDDTHVLVEVTLPAMPDQVSVDPDQILPDADPANNHWRPPINYRPRELYTFLDETAFTNDYDKWNVIFGPWAYGPPYSEGWFTRSTVLGVRGGVYRTEVFRGGVYAGYRPNFGDLAVGVDGHAQHFPYAKGETGINIEKSVGRFLADDDYRPDRAVVWTRHILEQTSSLYWLPREFIDGYAAYQHRWLPDPRQQRKGERIDPLTTIGLRYYRETYVPYWDPETGYRVDGNIALGLPLFGEDEFSGLAWGQVSGVTAMPEDLGWLSDVKFAARAFVGLGLPKDGRLFTLGGGQLFRGFDSSERQGSCLWIGSVELRFPVKPNLDWDFMDRIVRIANIYLAPFYDVGDIYLDGRSLGPVAHAVGVGIRFDVAFFRFLERATVRFDIAQAINTNTTTQFWFGLNHPF
jgi:hypothetical protein